MAGLNVIATGMKLQQLRRIHSRITPLHFAAWRGHMDICALLLSKGADANAKTNDGKTPMQHAQESRHIKIVDLLRKHGAVEREP